MRIALTGATGKIGRHLTHDLLRHGHHVRAMIRPTRDGFWGNTAKAVEELKQWGAELFEADFTNDRSLQQFVQNTDVLLHNGYHHVHEEHHPADWTNVNILATIKLYEYFWKTAGSKGKQIIFISSGAAYGKGPQQEQEKFPDAANQPIDERTPRAPRGLYAAYKSFIEDATAIFKTVHGLTPSTSLRPAGEGIGQLLGFRNYDDVGFFTEELKQLRAGKTFTLQLPPQITCVDGHDLANACQLIIEKGQQDPTRIQDWYIAGNTPITPEQFRHVFREIFGDLKLQIETVPQGRLTSDAELTRLGYRARGSEQTLRDHFRELAEKLGVPRMNQA